MNCNFLAKKVIAWFNVNQNAEKQKDFAFRCRGKELQLFAKLSFINFECYKKTWAATQNSDWVGGTFSVFKEAPPWLGQTSE